MKLKLLIISDLWGFDNSLWINNYAKLLESDFELLFYDACELAEIDTTNLTEKEIHSKFINGGITNAVAKLMSLENEKINVLGFSVGGTIAWKAALNGLNITNLYAISSTRLREESEKPNCKINLVFGEHDQYSPDSNWAKNLNLKLDIIKNGEHEIYKNKKVIKYLCNQIKKSNQKT